MKVKNFSVVGLVCLISVCLVGCSNSTKQKLDEKSYQGELMQKATETVGMPNITNFTEREMAKMIFELRDDANLITYSYVKNMNGKYTYLGQSVGYGLPYSVQYTAPTDINGDPQADPNGLYMPEGLSSTWVMLVDENTGDTIPVYVEDNLTVSQFKLPRRLCDESSLPENY